MSPEIALKKTLVKSWSPFNFVDVGAPAIIKGIKTKTRVRLDIIVKMLIVGPVET